MPAQMPPDELAIMNKPTHPQTELRTLSVDEWVETVLAPRRVEILTMVANTIYDHHKQLAIKNQQAQENSDEYKD